MIEIAIDILLWSLVVILGLMTASRSLRAFPESVRMGLGDFVRQLPRVFLGVVGSGYVAAMLPSEWLQAWLGPGSGFLGIAMSTLAGALMPGGAVIGFSLGAAALKGGAGAPQVIAFVTAWALFSVQRLISWEIAMLPARFVWLRAAASIPVPFLAAYGAILLGHP